MLPSFRCHILDLMVISDHNDLSELSDIYYDDDHLSNYSCNGQIPCICTWGFYPTVVLLSQDIQCIYYRENKYLGTNFFCKNCFRFLASLMRKVRAFCIRPLQQFVIKKKEKKIRYQEKQTENCQTTYAHNAQIVSQFLTLIQIHKEGKKV